MGSSGSRSSMVASRRSSPAPVWAEMATARSIRVSGGIPQQALADGGEIGFGIRQQVHLVQRPGSAEWRRRRFRPAPSGRARCARRRLARDVHHVQDQRGLGDLLEGGAERLHESGGEVADEADRVAEQYAAAGGKLSGRTVGSSVANMRASASTPARVRRLNSVDLPALVYPASARVASGTALAAAAVQGAAGAHAFQVVLDFLDAAGDAAAVGLELRFAGTAGADAAAQPGHFGAPAGQPGQQVVELRQFHLQAAFAGSGPGSEDVEDELGAIDDLGIEGLLEVALLGGGQVVVEDDDVDATRLVRPRRARSTLPLSDEGGGFGCGSRLNDGRRLSAPALAASSASSSSDSSASLKAARPGTAPRFPLHARPGSPAREEGGSAACSNASTESACTGTPGAEAAGPALRGSLRTGGSVGVGGLLRHHRGDGMLEDQLLLIIGFEHQMNTCRSS